MSFPLKILVQVKMQYAMQVSVMLLCCKQQEDITLHLENEATRSIMRKEAAK